MLMDPDGAEPFEKVSENREGKISEDISWRRDNDELRSSVLNVDGEGVE